MMVSWLGRSTNVREARAWCGGGTRGATLEQLAQGARAAGANARGLRVAPALPASLLPAIAHLRAGHFVVVERVAPRGVTLLDPAVGRRRVSRSEWESMFSGQLLVLSGQPPPRAEPALAGWPHFVWRLIHQSASRRLVALVLGSALALQLLGLTLPMLSAVVFDEVLAQGRASLLRQLVAAGICLAFATGLTSLLRALALARLQRRIDTVLTGGFVAKLLKLPYDFFVRHSRGELVQRLNSTLLLRQAFTAHTLTALLDGLVVLAYGGVLAARSVGLALCVVTLALLELLLLAATRRRSRELTSRAIEAESASYGLLVDVLSGMGSVKAAGAEPLVWRRWLRLFEQQLDGDATRNADEGVIVALRSVLHVVAPLALLALAAARTLERESSVGEMVGLVAVGMACLPALHRLLESAQSLSHLVPHLERVDEVMAEPDEQSGRLTVGRDEPLSCLELKNVSFSYPGEVEPVVSGVSLRIERGRTVALVGSSGSGKSTIAKLALGLHRPTSGVVLLNGADLHVYDARAVRRRMGAVLQHSAVFAGTPADNITFHREAAFSQVERAARLAQIHDELVALPLGYQTPLAEGGEDLSGGQQQRLAIARALFRHPALLIFDEATSDLDPVTEREVERHCARLGVGRLLITHRLSSAMHADEVLVLDRGRVVERGAPLALAGAGGAFAALLSASRRKEVEPTPINGSRRSSSSVQ